MTHKFLSTFECWQWCGNQREKTKEMDWERVVWWVVAEDERIVDCRCGTVKRTKGNPFIFYSKKLIYTKMAFSCDVVTLFPTTTFLRTSQKISIVYIAKIEVHKFQHKTHRMIFKSRFRMNIFMEKISCLKFKLWIL